MAHWRNGRGRSAAPIEHLSADRLGDMVNAERSNPPDLATLTRPHEVFPEETSVEYYSPPTMLAYEAPPALARAAPAPVQIEQHYTWDDSLPPAVLAVEIPMPEFEVPAVPEPAPASRAAKKSKRGRHRQPASLKHFGRGLGRSLRSALVTPRVVAMVGIIGLLVVATTVLGVF